MRTIQRLNSGSFLGGLLAVAVMGMFSLTSLTSYASNEPASDDAEGSAVRLAGSPAGVLTGTGSVSLNGVPTESGATVFSDSVITTGRDSIASVDLGPLGRFVIRPLTTVTVTISPERATIAARGKATRVNVLRGQVAVTSPGFNRQLRSGDDAVFADSVEATVSGDSVFTIQDRTGQTDKDQKDSKTQHDSGRTGEGPHPSPSPTPSKRKTAVIVPWWGWFGLAGAAGAIAAGQAAGGESGLPPTTNRVSSSRP